MVAIAQNLIAKTPKRRLGLSPELFAAFWQCRWYLAAAAVFSVGHNLLFLTLPLYMMQIFGRVLAHRSEETLILLTLLAGLAFLTMGALEAVRDMVLHRLSPRIERLLGERVMHALVERGAAGEPTLDNQGVRDLDVLRRFIAGKQMSAFLDLPWGLLFLGVIFIVHPWLGWIVTVGGLITLVLAWANERLTGPAYQRAEEASAQHYARTNAYLRNTEVVQAMGMMPGLLTSWQASRCGLLAEQTRSAEQAAAFGMGPVMAVRFMVLVALVGAGAYLIINRQLVPGAMFACVLLSMRALQPFQQLVSMGQALGSAHAALGRINSLLEQTPVAAGDTQLTGRPDRLSAEGLIYALPGGSEPFLQGITFSLAAGECLGIVGASGSGKTTLARLLAGARLPDAGQVRLDEVDIADLAATERRRLIGYLPQDVELFAGSVWQNISRFGAEQGEAVVEAARRAAAHELILRLPRGYETEVGDNGRLLSGGQRQRIALARALHGEPALVVLDEPDANLDTDGEKALMTALRQLKADGTMVVVVSHRPRMLQLADRLLVMDRGRIQRLGPTQKVLAQIAPGSAPAA